MKMKNANKNVVKSITEIHNPNSHNNRNNNISILSDEILKRDNTMEMMRERQNPNIHNTNNNFNSRLNNDLILRPSRLNIEPVIINSPEFYENFRQIDQDIDNSTNSNENNHIIQENQFLKEQITNLLAELEELKKDTLTNKKARKRVKNDSTEKRIDTLGINGQSTTKENIIIPTRN